jgi:regulator of protease activity HflC (stomatin/prohibitin superfamily)
MPKPTFVIQNGPAAGEMPYSNTELKAIADSCVKAALKPLTVAERQQLQAAITRLRTQVSAAKDRLQSRRAKADAQVNRLSAQAEALAAENDAFSRFYRQMAPAISSCSDAAVAVDAIHSAIQPTVRQFTELSYRVLIAKTTSALLAEQALEVQNALNYLDKVSVAIS